jgi:cytochrome c5
MKNIYQMLGMVLLAASASWCFAALSGSLSEKAIVERIKPVGEVTVIGVDPNAKAAAAASPADIGKNRYEQTCQMCHLSGIADAPKLGDKKAWAPRIAQGMDVMQKHAMEGLRAMPPKGGCTTCDEAEIRKTIEYMVSQSK